MDKKQSTETNWGDSQSEPYVIKTYKPKNDRFLYRLAMSVLSVITIVGVFTYAYIAIESSSIPSELHTLVMTAIAAVAWIVNKKGGLK